MYKLMLKCIFLYLKINFYIHYVFYRWLQWIHACKRPDLELKGPNYAHRNIRICHLHFEKKWYTKKNRVRLHPDAIPTIFFGAAFAKK